MAAHPWAKHLLHHLTTPSDKSDQRFPTPGALAHHLSPQLIDTPALQLVDAALTRTAATRNGRLIVSIAPQEGKSQRCSRAFPLWLLLRNPDTRIGIVSYGHDIARRWGRAIRDDIINHPDLGLQVRFDLSAQAEWQLGGHLGGVVTTGVGGSLTGRALDVLILDDVLKDREQADSPRYRERVWDWWTEVGATRLSPGAPVVQIATRWHEEDLAGQLLAAEDGHIWDVINIPAQADHDPAKGEVDILGRQPGQFLTSARGRTVEEWEAIKVRSGSRTWASLYQGRPSPQQGGIIDRTWWRFYDTPPWVERGDGTRLIPDAGVNPDVEVVQSWDMAFKDTKASDYVCGQVWLRRGHQAFLLDQVHGRFGFVETCQRMRELSARWPQAVAKLVEDKANGSAVIDALHHTLPGLIPVNPRDGKVARLNAVAPLIESGCVILPDPKLAPWVAAFIDEVAVFPNGAHDDRVDAMSQALTRLVLARIVGTGDVIDATEQYGQVDWFDDTAW